MDATALLADLDPEQRDAVTASSTLVAVIAGAGSGKTRVLTRRVAYRIAQETADARHTMVLTFTREAAGELRRRLGRLGVRQHVEAGTFHSVMLGILRQRWDDRGTRPLTILSDRDRLVSEVLGADRRSMAATLNEITWAGAHGLTAEQYAAAARRSGRRPPGGVEPHAQALADYHQLKRRRGVIDFDDVLGHVAHELRRDEAFADALRWRFRHLLVDEAQDLNPVQHQLIDLLRQGRDDLFLVGDPAQAIYGFNGADPRLLLDVETRFAGVEVIRLPVNHRCTPQVVDAANHVLASAGLSPDAVSGRGDGAPVRLGLGDDERGEAQRIVDLVDTVDPNLIRSGQLAVLARTNVQLRNIEGVLTARGIAIHRSPTAAGSPLAVAIRAAAGNTSATRLRAWAHDTLDGPPGPAPTPRSSTPDTERFAEAERRVAASALDFLRGQPLGDGATFRSWVATTNPFEESSEKGVELLTFHGAKGREWHTVAVTGVETSLVPHRTATTKALQAEEARLLYVAMTRATDALLMTRAARRGGYERDPSPFISDLPLGDAPPAPPPHRRRPQRRDTASTALTQWRASVARRAKILPQQVCSDRDLAAIARHRPSSIDELESLTSLGPMTAAKLGPELLAALHEPHEGGGGAG